MTSKEKDIIKFSLDGLEVEAKNGETIWQIAKQNNIKIPHLCHSDEVGYRPDGNCRTCMVEIDGERVLSASCIRKPQQGMIVNTNNTRVNSAHKMMFDLLLSDQPDRNIAHNKQSKFWHWADQVKISKSRFKAGSNISCDISHPAISVNLDACIHCNLCVRACDEIQVNDIIGMSGRGANSKIIFDMDDEMGASGCVACGECVQACPTGALMPSSMVDKDQIYHGDAEKIIKTLCPYCGVGCQTNIHVKDNKIIKVEGRDGPANQQRLCVKGRFGMDYASHKSRLTVPLIRKDNMEKSWDIKIDPSNPYSHFREATWDEALDKAANGFINIRKKHGTEVLAGFGSAKGSNEEAYIFQKLIRTGFGTNNVDHCTRLCHASSVAALMEGINSGAVSAPFRAAEDAEFIIIIGARPNWNHPVAASYIKQAAKNGTKIVIMDPRGQSLVRHAWKHLQFTAGRDVPMLNAIIHTIIDEDLIDHDYIKENVDNFDTLAKKVKQFSPEKMANICGIDAETLRQIARSYAKAKRAIIFWGMGVSQHTHGTDNVRSLIALATITGQIGRIGTGIHPLRGQNNVQGSSDMGLIPFVYPNYRSVEDKETRQKFEKLWGMKLNPNSGLTVVEIINDILADGIKGMYISGENPAMSDPDTKHARMALAKLEHLVVQDIFMTETAFHADIILPASSFLEKTGTFTNTNRTVQIGRPALDLPGDAKQDWWITKEIANRMGLGWTYEHPKDIFCEITSVMDNMAGISWDRLEREEAVTYPCLSQEDAGQPYIFTNGFPTKNGKAKLVPTDLIAPAELPDDQYPMILTTGRLLEHWHTGAMTRRSPVLDSIEPEAIAHLNPRFMEKNNINAGDMINIKTRRGEIKIKARMDRDVAVDMVFVPFCFAESPANILTSSRIDPFGKIPEFKHSAALVEKI